MKHSLIALATLTAIFTANAAKADLIEKTLMKDYLPTNMDYMFEVKTTKFDKVILDCQSFIHGITFYKNKKVIHSFYLEDDQCQDMHNYLKDSNDGKVPVCFEISDDGKSLNLVNEKNECI